MPTHSYASNGYYPLRDNLRLFSPYLLILSPRIGSAWYLPEHQGMCTTSLLTHPLQSRIPKQRQALPSSWVFEEMLKGHTVIHVYQCLMLQDITVQKFQPNLDIHPYIQDN